MELRRKSVCRTKSYQHYCCRWVWQQCQPHPHSRSIKKQFRVFSALKDEWTTSKFAKQTETQAAVTHLTHAEMSQGNAMKVFELGLCSLAVYCEGKQQQAKIESLNLRRRWLQFTCSTEPQFTNHLCVAVWGAPLVSTCQQLKGMFQPLSFALKKKQKTKNRPEWDQGCSSCGMNNSFRVVGFLLVAGSCAEHAGCCLSSVNICIYWRACGFPLQGMAALNQVVKITCHMKILLVHCVCWKRLSSRHAGQDAPTWHKQLERYKNSAHSL